MFFDSSMDRKIMGMIIKIIASSRYPSKTKPRKRTLRIADDKGSLALTTDTTKGETRETAFIDRKKAKAVPKKAIVKHIQILMASTWKLIL